MYSTAEYISLVKKYGPYSSWALWDLKKESDTAVIYQNIDKLNSKFVIIGLNISKPLSDSPWSNFHGGKHDRKLKYACTDNLLTGVYLTDIFKGVVEPNSHEFRKVLSENTIKENVCFFNQEMKDIKITSDTQFILLGSPTSLLAKYFNKFFKTAYETNSTIYYYHHSYYRLTDRTWVTGLWDKLDIRQDYESTMSKYKKN